MKTPSLCVVLALLSTTRFAMAQQGAPSLMDVAAAASFSVPRLIRFSRLAQDTNGKPLTGTIGLTFSLYKDEQGSAPLWMETQNVHPDASGHLFRAIGVDSTRRSSCGLVYIW